MTADLSREGSDELRRGGEEGGHPAESASNHGGGIGELVSIVLDEDSSDLSIVGGSLDGGGVGGSLVSLIDGPESASVVAVGEESLDKSSVSSAGSRDDLSSKRLSRVRNGSTRKSLLDEDQISVDTERGESTSPIESDCGNIGVAYVSGSDFDGNDLVLLVALSVRWVRGEGNSGTLSEGVSSDDRDVGGRYSESRVSGGGGINEDCHLGSNGGSGLDLDDKGELFLSSGKSHRVGLSSSGVEQEDRDITSSCVGDISGRSMSGLIDNWVGVSSDWDGYILDSSLDVSSVGGHLDEEGRRIGVDVASYSSTKSSLSSLEDDSGSTKSSGRRGLKSDQELVFSNVSDSGLVDESDTFRSRGDFERDLSREGSGSRGESNIGFISN